MALYAGDSEKRSRLSLLDIFPRGTRGAGHEPTVGSGGDIPLVIKIPQTLQTVDCMEIQLADGTVIFAIDKNGNIVQSGVTNVKKLSSQVTLSSAQITTLHSVPVSLVAAAGAGTVILVNNCIFQFKYGTVQYTGGGAVNPVYHGATTNLLTGSVAAATIQAAASATVSCGAEASALTLSTNTGVDLSAGTADFAAGDGTAVVSLSYWVITLS